MPLCPLRQRRRKIPPEDVFGFGGFFGWHGLSDCAIEGGALPITGLREPHDYRMITSEGLA